MFIASNALAYYFPALDFLFLAVSLDFYCQQATKTLTFITRYEGTILLDIMPIKQKNNIMKETKPLTKYTTKM